jgi:5-methylcytosine-specific restriction endonuclease McrA
MLMDESALQDRIFAVYRAMKTSAKPKLYKKGRKKGQVRIPGLKELPFTRIELWHHAVAQVGETATRCQYCVAIGRPANIITLATCVFDHKVPKVHAGADLILLEVWSLPNIFAVCADCNVLKGKLTYRFFIALMSEIELWDDPRDRDSIYACLRTHGVTLRRYGTDRREVPPAEELPTTGVLALQEDF